MKKGLILTFSIAVFAAAIVSIFYLAGMFMLLHEHQPLSGLEISTWNDYRTYYHEDLKLMKTIKITMMGAVTLVIFVPLLVVVAVTAKKKTLYGDARFATTAEVMKSELGRKDSSPKIIVGKIGRFFLQLPGELFVALAAATRSGKSISAIIPNLLNWAHSCVATDIKVELYNLTSKVRAFFGHEVHLFQPFTENRESSCYNPFYYVRNNEFKLQDILDIAETIYPVESGKDPFWPNSSRNLFLALSLYISETPDLPFTIGEVFRQGSFKGKKPRAFWDEVINARNYQTIQNINIETAELIEEKVPLSYEEWLSTRPDMRNPNPPLSDECQHAISRFLNNADDTLNSIIASFISPLLIWANPVVDAATSANDFDFSELRKKRITIYVAVNADKLAVSPAIVNLFYSQLIKINLRTLPEDDADIKYQCLLLLDEFTAPGTIKIIDDANGYLASYWLRPLFSFQGVSQLEADPPKGYGKLGAKTLLTNSGLKIVHTPDDQKEAEEVSKSLGFMTVMNKTYSRSHGKHHNRTVNTAPAKRELMLPQEVRELPFTKQFIFMKGMKPILCDKIFWYKEPIFIDKIKKVSPMLAKLGKAIPTREQLDAARIAGELRHPPKKLVLKSNVRYMSDDDLEAHINKFLQGNDVPKEPTLEDLMYDEDGNYIANDESEADCIAAMQSEEVAA